MKNGQPDAQGQLLLENVLPSIPENEEKMEEQASSIADMMKSPEMKFFRKFPKKISEEVITIEDSDEDPIVIKDFEDENKENLIKLDKEYKKAIKIAKRKSWQGFMNSIVDPKSIALLNKLLHKVSAEPIGLLKNVTHPKLN